jgi:hypothetical protein
MKRIKKLFVNLIAMVMLVASCLSLTACKDIRTLELSVQVYDYKASASKTVTLTVDLYAHLAPKTVDAIEKYVNEGYYDGAIFYQLEGYSSQLMLGDLVEKDGEIAQNAIKPQLPGEFVRGGTVGSNLTSVKGSIGLWRDWFAYDGNYKTNNALDSGRATWYIPTDTTEIKDYADWFCVFAQIDLEDEENANALTLIADAYGSSADVKKYEVYYTGEYDAEKVDENNGLKFNCELEVLFNEDDVKNLFKAEGAEYQSYMMVAEV